MLNIVLMTSKIKLLNIMKNIKTFHKIKTLINQIELQIRINLISLTNLINFKKIIKLQILNHKSV